MVTIRSGKNITHSDQIGDNVILADDIAPNAVDASEIAADAVRADEIQAGAVGASEIATDGVGADEISAGAVGASEIADEGVGQAEMEDGTQGDIPYYGAGGEYARLGAGTDGQFLKTRGAGANPEWGSIAAFEKLAEATFNIVATTNTFTANAGTDFCTSAGTHNLENGDKVILSTDGTLPAGLSATTYYVRDKTATTFKLSSVPFGTAIDITDAGTGTHTWALRAGAMKVSFTAKTLLKLVIVSVAPTVSGRVRMNFNEDGGANYSYQEGEDGGAMSGAGSTNFIQLHGNADTKDTLHIVDIINIATVRKPLTKMYFQPGAAAAQGKAGSGGGHWNNTSDQINSVNVYLEGTGAFAAGSKVFVLGTN